jgi:hemolysin activation/secretion protein
MNNSFFEYEQSVLGSSTDFLSHGSSFNMSFSADHLFYRGQADKLNLAVSLTRKESRNFIEDVFLDTSSRTLYVWDLATRYILHMPFGSLNAAFHLNKSVAWFDAKRELAAAEDDFQFTKYLLDVGFSSRFQLGMQTVQYSTNLHLLYSPQTILASEGITVGGRYSVRGLSQSSLFGYRGGYIRNDFTLPFETSWPALQHLDILFGLDVGSTNLPEFSDKGSDWVAGANLSIRLYDELFNITLSYARALRVPDFLNAQRQELDLSVRFNF